jgi:hypothetical protein
MLLGLALMVSGRRRDELEAMVRPIFDVEFAGRVLAFDVDAADAYAEIAALAKRSGRAVSQSDAQIAAIVRCRRARLATRNVRDFTNCGIDVVDPWTAA